MQFEIFLFAFLYFLIILSAVYLGFDLYGKVKHRTFLKALTITSAGLSVLGFLAIPLASISKDLIILFNSGFIAYITLFITDIWVSNKNEEEVKAQ